MNTNEIAKTLRWLAKETEFVFAAETLQTAANEINHLKAEMFGQAVLIESMQAEILTLKEIAGLYGQL